LALAEDLLSSAQLADDLFGCVALALHGASTGQAWPAGKLSQGLVQFLGPRQGSVHKRVRENGGNTTEMREEENRKKLRKAAVRALDLVNRQCRLTGDTSGTP